MAEARLRFFGSGEEPTAKHLVDGTDFQKVLEPAAESLFATISLQFTRSTHPLARGCRRFFLNSVAAGVRSSASDRSEGLAAIDRRAAQVLQNERFRGQKRRKVSPFDLTA